MYSASTIDASSWPIPFLGFAVQHLLRVDWDAMTNHGKNGKKWIAQGLPTHINQYVQKIYTLAESQEQASVERGHSNLSCFSGSHRNSKILDGEQRQVSLEEFKGEKSVREERLAKRNLEKEQILKGKANPVAALKEEKKDNTVAKSPRQSSKQ